MIDREGQWHTVDETIDDAKANKLLSEYEAYRATLPATVQGNWRAAQWCAKNGFVQQCRAHLLNILVMDPDHTVARGLLGYQMIGGEWVTPEQRYCMQEKVAFAQLSGFRQAFGKESMNDVRLFQVDTGVGIVNVGPRTWQKPAREESTNWTLLARDESKPFGTRNTWLKEKTETEYQLMVDEESALIEAVTKAAANATMFARVASAAAENQVIQGRNTRIANVIEEVGEVEFRSLPGDVWKWWDEYNETDYQRSKRQRSRRESLGFVAHRYHDYSALTNREYTIEYGSCFVAGTPVNTLRGMRAIEPLQPGDMVLSRDIRTGELCYRPVVTATTRAPAKTVILQVDDEKIHATTSHLLWVSGKGWVKAGDIEPGDLLHSASEPAVVMSVTPDAVLPTHNLIVADTHAYFVGASRVLSHDVLPRTSVHELIPGHFVLTKQP